jgi:hypothetical protein
MTIDAIHDLLSICFPFLSFLFLAFFFLLLVAFRVGAWRHALVVISPSPGSVDHRHTPPAHHATRCALSNRILLTATTHDTQPARTRA